ncbi:hypothetical protein AXG93_4461s1080 [Marchantia polymorpha subsp. ruderalis]|uniref:Uncharacterized protein n=1 Tax=Marchantia polymorpha subsp. ruderalis TaxID=1480154 RepID=A0A176WPV6_MARPO|nr:hypothetical protein AXG93_4461s1080 [Marchantia polymorpha subsp. ruderalis]
MTVGKEGLMNPNTCAAADDNDDDDAEEGEAQAGRSKLSCIREGRREGGGEGRKERKKEGRKEGMNGRQEKATKGSSSSRGGETEGEAAAATTPPPDAVPSGVVRSREAERDRRKKEGKKAAEAAKEEGGDNGRGFRSKQARGTSITAAAAEGRRSSGRASQPANRKAGRGNWRASVGPLGLRPTQPGPEPEVRQTTRTPPQPPTLNP